MLSAVKFANISSNSGTSSRRSLSHPISEIDRSVAMGVVLQIREIDQSVATEVVLQIRARPKAWKGNSLQMLPEPSYQ